MLLLIGVIKWRNCFQWKTFRLLHLLKSRNDAQTPLKDCVGFAKTTTPVWSRRDFICRIVGPRIFRKNTVMGSAVTVQTRVAVILWRLATEQSYRSCGLMFGLSKSTAIYYCTESIREICRAKQDYKILTKIINTQCNESNWRHAHCHHY